MAIDLARVQACPKPCGVANLPPWNRAAEIRRRSEVAFRRLDFRRKHDLHIASAIAAAHTEAAEVCLKPKRFTDAQTLLLSSWRCALERIDLAPAPSSISRRSAKPRYSSAAGSGHVGKFATGEAPARSQRINIEVGLDGMTSLVGYQDVGDRALYPLQRPAPPSATDAGVPEHTRMRTSLPQKTAAPERGHAGGMQ